MKLRSHIPTKFGHGFSVLKPHETQKKPFSSCTTRGINGNSNFELRRWHCTAADSCPISNRTRENCTHELNCCDTDVRRLITPRHANAQGFTKLLVFCQLRKEGTPGTKQCFLHDAVFRKKCFFWVFSGQTQKIDTLLEMSEKNAWTGCPDSQI